MTNTSPTIEQGRVTYWSVYEQSWTEATSLNGDQPIPERELAAMSATEREQVLAALPEYED